MQQDKEDLTRLREFIKAHPKFTAPAPTPDDLDTMRDQYREYMEKHHFNEDEIFLYLTMADYAFKACCLTSQSAPEYDLIRELMFKYEQASIPRDQRNQNYVIYPVDVVLMVVMLAKLCGCNNCKEYAGFWFKANPFLQCLVPGMPSPCYMISRETVATSLKMVPNDGYEKIFNEMFAEVKIKLRDLLSPESKKPEDCNFRPTIGGDGQELRASYRKGEISRRKKGAHGVVAYDCDNRVALGYTTVNRKNHEINGFMRILQQIDLPDNAIFYADALNTRQNFVDFLNERHVDWLLAIKGQKATKFMYDAIKERFESGANVTFKKVLPPQLVSGRIEERTVEAVPVSELGVEKDFSAKTAIKITKHTSFKTNGAEKEKRDTTVTRYYISSLECTLENFEQIIHSILVRWFYESHHSTIDNVLLQDKQAVCNEEHLAAIIGLNKFAFNVLSFARQVLSKEGFTLVKHRTKNFKPMSYQETADTLRDQPLRAMKVLIRYLMTDKADA